MPFFTSPNKRRKCADASNIYAPQPPPYAVNNFIPGYHETQPQWPAPHGPHLAPVQENYMTSTMSLPPTPYLQPVPLQPQHTWPQPQMEVVPRARPWPPIQPDMRTRIDDKLADVISLMDEDDFSGLERELMIPTGEETQTPPAYSETRDISRALKAKAQPGRRKEEKEVNVFSKLDLYMNSRLPTSLPPFRVYMPTWPLLCLAAQYSNSAYTVPQKASERKDFVSASGRLGTKAMVIKSIPCDDKKTIVFAIRGTSMFSIRDWGVNLATEPASPAGFLDDEGNLCHAGFLRVAKAMIKPIATRLRSLLEENPSRSSCSLLITGHSAGGAVASLLYSHMLSQTVQSELSILTGCFKRVHCVTFGAPPVTLLPLQKPDTADGRLRKCLFHSFINEGDPVVRAEKAYMRSLVDLLSRPVPSLPNANSSLDKCTSLGALASLGASMSRLDLSLAPSKPARPKPKPQKSKPPALPLRKWWWEVPPATLSNAGRVIVLRAPDGPGSATKVEGVTASLVTDEQLRQVIFGDPLAHSMVLYAERIEMLAVRAVTGRNGAC